jgi:hypothetical protein
MMHFLSYDFTSLKELDRHSDPWQSVEDVFVRMKYFPGLRSNFAFKSFFQHNMDRRDNKVPFSFRFGHHPYFKLGLLIFKDQQLPSTVSQRRCPFYFHIPRHSEKCRSRVTYERRDFTLQLVLLLVAPDLVW